MLPELCLNCIPVIALVVLKYPPTKVFTWKFPEDELLLLLIKCFTKVVELGLNKNNSPEVEWSLSLPIYASISINPVVCASSCAVSYPSALAEPSSLCDALKKLVVEAVL